MADLEAGDFDNPNPSIHDLFSYYNQIYFEGKLGPCTLQWSSKRMTLCAGVCQYSTYGGCEIRLSEPLLKYRPVSDLKNTLLHEMIHAYLFLTNGNKDHDDHGPRFQHLMMMINDFALVDEERPEDGYAVTVYHNFTDEVDLYRTHHWKCDNCSDLIKRAMNRTPSVSDCLERSQTCLHPRCHWHTHQRRCGGSYEKIKEPAGYVDKRKRAVDGDDVTMSGQKRRMSTTGGPSKKGTKEPPAQGKTASLDTFFLPVQKGEGKILYTQTVAIEDPNHNENPSEGKTLSLSEINGQRKFNTLNDTPQKESRSDLTEEDKEESFGSQSSDLKREEGAGSLPRQVTPTQMEDALLKAGNEEDAIKTRGSKRTASPPRQARESARLKAARQTGHGKESSGICLDSPSRKKFKSVDELLKKQGSKEPIVILAWANWVSYESDEENEEPLVNRRSARRKQVGISELLKKGKTVLTPSDEDTVMATGEGLEKVQSEYPDETPQEEAVEQNSQANGHVDHVVLMDDGDEKPPVMVFTKNSQIFIELSDDEKVLEAAGKKSEGSNGSDGSSSVSEKAPGLRIPSTRATRRGRSEALEAKELSSAGNRETGRQESTSQTEMMMCPICNLVFKDNEKNTFVNKHIDECLTRCA